MIQEIYIIDGEDNLFKKLNTLFYEEDNFCFTNIKEQKLEIALKNIPALIIIHEDTLQTNIIDICNKIRENDDNRITPVIVISSNTDYLHRIEVFKASVEQYIKKPINEQYLYYTIKQDDNIIDSTGTSTKIGGTSYGTADVSMTYVSKTHILEVGTYTLEFTYRKDSSDDSGTDSGYVKNVKVIDGAEARITYLIEQGGGAASTTGNVTGIYDMAGGSWEYVMGNYGKTAGSSGLTVSEVPAEHIDIYSGTSVSASHLGDALGETAGWYSDSVNFVYSSSPWFNRGGGYSGGDNAGVFYFSYSSGGAITNSGFRVVLSTTGA